jgi:hypothetical protein
MIARFMPAAASLAFLSASSASAQIRASGYDLPAILAVEAAQEAIRSC